MAFRGPPDGPHLQPCERVVRARPIRAFGSLQLAGKKRLAALRDSDKTIDELAQPPKPLKIADLYAVDLLADRISWPVPESPPEWLVLQDFPHLPRQQIGRDSHRGCGVAPCDLVSMSTRHALNSRAWRPFSQVPHRLVILAIPAQKSSIIAHEGDVSAADLIGVVSRESIDPLVDANSYGVLPYQLGNNHLQLKLMKRKVARGFSYSVFYEQAAEGGYVASVPALSGCHTQGETLEEAERNIKEAIALYLESLAAHGEAIPQEGPSFQGRVSVPVSIPA